MESLPHRIEVLPGDGRYAVTFRRPDGGEQSTVAHVEGDDVVVAESGLPTGWSTTSEAFAAVARAVNALHESRHAIAPGLTLRDVDGGWDVGLGNVVLSAGGSPVCIAHGMMAESGNSWLCGQCQARAVLG